MSEQPTEQTPHDFVDIRRLADIIGRTGPDKDMENGIRLRALRLAKKLGIPIEQLPSILGLDKLPPPEDD